MPRPVLLIHGGAGDITDARVPGKFNGIKEALRRAWPRLQAGQSVEGSAADAVEWAIQSMELNECFNAGHGSCLNTAGDVEMEASFMEGQDLRAGCITLLRDILHPISVARKLMEKKRHVFIGGLAAQEFALGAGFEKLAAGTLVTESAQQGLLEFKRQQLQGKDVTYARTELDQLRTDPSGETVGAVAMDELGNIVVGTSTGGITGKWPGRIGDTPLLGCGTYADNTVGGVSTTGHGETIMRYNLAQRILSAIKHQGLSAQAAAEQECKLMTQRLGGTGGAIVVDYNGEIGVSFSSRRMAWGYIQNGTIFYGIDQNVVLTESFDTN
ncbi:probable isoaspartyl peptidase/L-asparaginase GA20639 [Scaptodrosophila lebanonensis]|uniref:Probable isoaspartyl peptidase/L-asparaginase GA20639 n=1 Tax=Drosophila lebanonensis TaxID=7225 RepID=A0A6J2TXQ3_DROLE|nr:probable isoaspartyl peptidase/L-asparaginase GA20639 [Scaptodrosophila lebanonensis]